MKTNINNLMTIAFVLLTLHSQAQTKRPTLTVLNIDTKGITLDAQQMGNLARIELEKLDSFDVTDRYDVGYLVEKNKLNITNCYGKLCLLEVGNTIQTDYMFTGSVDLYGETIITTFRLINIKTGVVERTAVDEYLNLPLEVQQMVAISIRKLFGKSNDELQLMRLTKKFDYENSINNPNQSRVNLSGPRFGYTFIFGHQATRLTASQSQGGFEAYPAMFQFGYQFEKQYLNEGNYQALFEFIPMMTGLDQQMAIPSFTFLNGFRNNKMGWEIAIGPSFSVARFSKLALIDGQYYTEKELKAKGIEKYDLQSVLDSRGNLDLHTSLIFGLGKTFKSGKMNIPVNIWSSILNKDGFRVGISIGYNSKK